MKILVTGHEGFIGGNLENYLREYGEDVVGYEYDPHVFPNVKGYDWVIHLGAISSTRERDLELIMSRNWDFSCRLLRACNRHLVNFQYASSASIYGSGICFREDTPPQPSSGYAWSKWLFERFVAQHKWRIHVQGFRYFNV